MLIPSQRPQLLIAAPKEDQEALRPIFSSEWELIETESEQQALSLLKRHNLSPSGVILGGISHTADGELIHRWLKQNTGGEIPLFIILAAQQEYALNRYFELDAAEALVKPLNPVVARRRVRHCVQLFRRRAEITRLAEQQLHTVQQPAYQQNIEAIIDTMSALVEFRNFQSGVHVRKIRQITWLLLQELKPYSGMTIQQIEQISTAASMHDIGKIAIPDDILLYPGPLDEKQMEIVRMHTIKGCEIIQRMNPKKENQILLHAAQICLSHHERWDGSGYPHGLRGDQIPLSAQIVGLADVYDAITSDRTYKQAHPHRKACQIIESTAGSLFSPLLIKAFHTIKPYLEQQPGQLPVPAHDLPSAEELELERLLRRVALESNEYRQLSALSGDLYFYYDYREQTVEYSSAFSQVFCTVPTAQKIPFSQIRQVLQPELLQRLCVCLNQLSPDNPQLKTELELKTAEGGQKWFECYFCTQYSDNELTHFYGKFIDIDQLKNEANLWKEQAQTDQLTGLLNRGAMQHQVEQLLKRRQPLTFLFIDLDDFKNINDTYGHLFGDRVLRHISHQIKTRMRTGDLIGRIGGDEFLAVLPGAGNPEQLARRAGQLLAIFSIALPVDDASFPQKYKASGSIGISVSPEDGTEYADLLRKADIALYTAKKSGKNTWRFFTPEMMENTTESVLSEIN